MSVSFLKKSEFAALAAALALVGVSGEAYAQDGRGRWSAGAQADPGNGGAEMRQQRQEARQARQQQRQAQRAEAQTQRQAQRAQAPSEQAWQGRGRAADAPRRGSQRPADGQSYGRDRSGRAVTRAAPAWRGATPAAPQVRAPAQQAEPAVGRYRDRNRDGGRERWDSTRRDGNTVQAPRNRTYRDASREDRNRGTWNRNDRDRGGWNDSDRNRQAWRDGNQRRWDRDNWRRDNRYDWQRYRNQNRSAFRIGVYSSPYRNWSYRRLGIGTALNSLFFSSRYWIQDPWQYRLPEVYGPYRWVRYYDDVLLVDIYSGEVVDVIYNFFW